MALGCATPTSSLITGTSVALATTGETGGGGGPYTYQWYQSLVSGFTPGASNLVTGQTGLTYNASGLLLGAYYYFKVVVTDATAPTVPATSTALAVQLLTTPPVGQSMNQFAMQPYLGMPDLHLNYNTMEVQFDPAGSGTIAPGQALVWSTSTTGGSPKVVPSTSVSDVVVGFANFNLKNSVWVPGDKLEMSRFGNVMYLLAVVAVNRGVCVTSLPTGANGGVGCVTAVTGSSGYRIVGVALDNIAAGTIGRIQLLPCDASYAID